MQDLRDDIQTLYAEQIAAGYQAYRLHFELAPQAVERPKEAKKTHANKVTSNGGTHANHQENGTDCLLVRRRQE